MRYLRHAWRVALSGALAAVASLAAAQTDAWTPVSGCGPAGSLASGGAGRLFAGVGRGTVLRSSDDGLTWSSCYLPLRTGPVSALLVPPGGSSTPDAPVYAAVVDCTAASQGALFRSTDIGATWVRCDAGLSHPRVQCMAVDSEGVLFAGTDRGGLYRSTNRGDLWVPAAVPSGPVRCIIATPAGRLFVACASPTSAATPAVFRSTDHGESWTQCDQGLTAPTIGCLAFICPRGPAAGSLLAGTCEGLFRSTDDGGTWAKVPADLASPSIRCLVSSPAGVLFAGTEKYG